MPIDGLADVRQFGAKGNGVSDDLPALNIATSILTAGGGGTIYFPPGYYRITGQWAIGSQAFDSFEFITNRTEAMGDALVCKHQLSAAVAANNEDKGGAISIEFSGGAYLVADFSPKALTPVVGYYYGPQIGNAYIRGLSVITPQVMTNGVFTPNAGAAPNNLIGLFAQSGLRSISNVLMSGVQHGIVTLGAFWTSIRDVYAYGVPGDTLNIALGNALTVDQIVSLYGGRGLVFDGGASQLRGLHTEEVGQDIVVFAAESCVIGPGYLEDKSASPGAGTYAVTLGTTQNGLEVLSTTITGLRVGSARSGKKAFRVWGSRNLEMKGVRSYSIPSDFDDLSYGILSDTDFSNTTQFGRFISQGDGFYFLKVNAPATDHFVYGPWIFSINDFKMDPIPAGSDYGYVYKMPFTLPAVTLSVVMTYTSGGPGDLISKVNVLSGNEIQITWTNTTNSPIGPNTFNFNLLVFVGQ